MTQQFGLGRSIGVAQGLQGLRANQQQFDVNQMNMQNVQADRAAAQQAAEAEARRKQLLQQKLQGVVNPETGQLDPAGFTDLLLTDPETAGAVREQFGLVDEQRNAQLVNQAFGAKQLIESAGTPEAALQALQNSGLMDDPMFAQLADNLQAGDMQGALNEIGYGVAVAGGPEAYNSMFGKQQDPTAFMQEMMAAGIDPGSQAYRDAVLERYGKGQTIGYDVVEAVNPETGRNEYYQVSRVDPGRQIPLGIEVPTDPRVTAAQSAAQNEQAQAQSQELETIGGMLQNIGQIKDSPGLDSWSGIEGFVPIIPGTEQANTDAYIERLKSQQFLENIGAMKGMGALSNAEGMKVSAAAASINRFMTDKAIRAELDRIEAELQKAKERIESGNLLTPEQVSGGGSGQQGRGSNAADRAANAAANSGAMTPQDADAFIDSYLRGGQ